MKGTVKIHFTNGVGNNIFQYVYARLVAEKNDMFFSHPALLPNELGIYRKDFSFDKNVPVIKIRASSKNPFNYHSLFAAWKQKVNYDLKVYPEDFTLYVDKMGRIRSWFPVVEKANTKDLVFHLRLGDRLVMESTYMPGNYISIEEYIAAINTFDFDRLHIVTDMPVWGTITEQDVRGFTFHRTVKPEDRIDPKVSVKYFNLLYEGLSQYDPMVRVGNSVGTDFDYIRSFDKVLFQHGTLAWWAAALSGASEVALYGKWREGKNINLGETDLPGWRQWGKVNYE